MLAYQNWHESRADLEVGAPGLISRNVSVSGRRTSIRLEPEMWQAFQDIARREACSVHMICTLVEKRKRANTTLTAGIRVFIMLYFRAAATDEGHIQARHGHLLARVGMVKG
jgi:predicted DNA-binding ribbon-helix-helix protein